MRRDYKQSFNGDFSDPREKEERVFPPETGLYEVIFNSTPHAVFVVNRNFQIQDANAVFKDLYPRYESNNGTFCYRVIPPERRDTPCNDCIVRKTFLTGSRASEESQIRGEAGPRHLRKETVPLPSDSGETIAVMEIIEDITETVQTRLRLERHARELEDSLTQKMNEQREKEKKLTAAMNTVYEMKGAHDINESIDIIVRGYRELGARTIAFALYDDDEMYIAKVHPEEVVKKLNAVFRRNIPDLRLAPVRDPQNPFSQTALVGKPVFYKGAEEVYGFFKNCFPKSYDHSIAEAAYLFEGQSLVIFPLKTKNATVGAIAVSADIESLEQNFEYFSFLSNSSAVEISRQRSSQKLHRSETKYRNLVESSRDMIILCGKDGRIRYSNRIFFDLTGVSPRQNRELSLYSFFQGTHRERIKEAIQSSSKSKEAGKPIELKMKTRDGSELWAELIINPVADGESGFQIVARDISHRKDLETRIGNLSAFQERILQNDFIGIVATDLSGRITSWNAGAANILGYRPEEALGKNISGFIINEVFEPSSQFMKEESAAVPHISREMRFRKKNGDAVRVMYVETTMRDEANNPIAVIAYFFDITERARLDEQWKELNQRLHQAQLITIVSLAKLAEYRDIETGSHLERIMKYTELLSQELSSFKEYRDYISNEYIIDLVNSCPLHDIGKVGIPDAILHKPGKLTPAEFEIIKKHSIIGGDTIAEAEKKVHGRSYLNLGKEVAYYHHERWDGRGYPSGLKGVQIPLSARIVAVADVYDALISKRPYKEAFTHDTSREIITAHAGSHFDESVVRAFLNREQEIIDLKNRIVN